MQKRKNKKLKPVKKVNSNRLAPKRIVSKMGMWSVLIALFILALDQGSKHLVSLHIPQMIHETQWYPYNGIGIFENFWGIEFSIVHATNRGAAWGLFSDFQSYLVAFRMFFIGGLFVYLVGFNKNKYLNVPLTLIVAGALGNILDYLIYGHVIDMFHFVFWGHHFAIFNVADSAISIGVTIVILMTLGSHKNPLQLGSVHE